MQRFRHATALRRTRRTACAGAAAALLFAAPAAAQNRCTRDSLTVQGTPIAVEYCVTAMGRMSPGSELPVTVSELYHTNRGTVRETKAFRFIAGEPSSRVIDDLDLAPLGLKGTLHLTLVLRGGTVALEGAMLTPGAVTIR